MEFGASISQSSVTWNGDEQVPTSKSCSNHSICNILLGSLTKHISELTGKNLIPTYSYTRIYLRGAELTPHKDRPSCEYSVTLNLAQTHPWPLFMGKSEVNLTPGDGVIYKGCEIEHYRKKFEGDSYTQVFLHYVDADGPYRDHMYDFINTKKKEETFEIVLPDIGHNHSNYYKIHNALPDIVIDRLISKIQEDKLSAAMVGTGDGVKDLIKRRSQVYWIPKTKEYIELYTEILKAAVACNAEFYQFKLSGLPEKIQYTVYTENDKGHYDWHIDMGPMEVNRKLSVVVQLSDPSEYEGGDLEINNGKIVQVEKEKGTMILFPSYMLHRVTPVTKGTRRTLVAWINGPAFV